MNEHQFALYTNHKGQPVTHSSYSARQTFKKCPREFELTRIQGWSDKERRAAPLFGKCVEAGAQFHEDNSRKPGTAVERFVSLWNEVKLLPEFLQLRYTDSENGWESLLRAGTEMMKLYEIRAPFLPISTNPKALWQQTLRKQLFPGSELKDLENKAVLDLLSYPRWNHPLLPKIDQPTEDLYRPLIIDIKTSGEDLSTDLIALDPQLTEYAWQGRIPDIAFLWFVKRGHELRKGSRVTLLEEYKKYTVPTCKDCGAVETEEQKQLDKDCRCGGQFERQTRVWHAGYELIVLTVDNDTAYVGEYSAYTEYDAALKGLRGKARDAAEMAHLIVAEDAGKVAAVGVSSLTKQRLQFAAARLTEADMNEIGRDVAQTTVEMVRAHREGYYPKLAGIRFPNQKCNYCSMRFICLNRPDERDRNLTRKGEEWLDGIYEEE
jgi:hypothetical protein